MINTAWKGGFKLFSMF